MLTHPKPLTVDGRKTVSPRLEHFLSECQRATPFLVVDLELVKAKYLELQEQFSQVHIYYAVKANPAPKILKLLNHLGAKFEVASRPEIELCMQTGISPERIAYGNTIKKAKDIFYAHRVGVRRFAFDSTAELIKLAKYAPGSEVYCRLLTSGDHADWPLSRKFGCDLEMAYRLLLHSARMRLKPIGVSFHVGSQQTDPAQWDAPLRDAAQLFGRLEAAGVQLSMINLGGGFPAHYQAELPSLQNYALTVLGAVTRNLGAYAPQVVLEPGRFLVADAGLIQSEVVLISRKAFGDPKRWVYLDIGKFNGLIETMDEAIKFRLRSARGGPTGPVILAGPSSDSADILYEKTCYHLPLELQIGDRLELLSAGAYTATAATVGYNGFVPLTTYCI